MKRMFLTKKVSKERMFVLKNVFVRKISQGK
jgi:hypothetical protein